MATRLKPGAIFVTFTKGLNSDKFEVLDRRRYKMSWGPATVFIHRRLHDSGEQLPPYRFNLLPNDAEEYNGEEDLPNDDEDSSSNNSEDDEGFSNDDEDYENEEFDEIGNLIKKTVYENSNVMYTEEYKYEYYIS